MFFFFFFPVNVNSVSSKINCGPWRHIFYLCRRLWTATVPTLPLPLRLRISVVAPNGLKWKTEWKISFNVPLCWGGCRCPVASVQLSLQLPPSPTIISWDRPCYYATRWIVFESLCIMLLLLALALPLLLYLDCRNVRFVQPLCINGIEMLM